MELTVSVLWSMRIGTAPHAYRSGPLPAPCLGVAVTVHVIDGRPLFRARVFARHCVDFLRALGTITGTRVYAFCLLPDHARLVLGLPPGTSYSSVDSFVDRWKDLCSREWHRRSHQSTLWQPGFESLPLVSTADLALARERVLDTPVQEGLAASREEYPLAGTCPLP